jgi:hypothetical protein
MKDNRSLNEKGLKIIAHTHASLNKSVQVSTPL